MPDQAENRPKLIDPHFDPWSCVVAYTRFWPLYGAVVKSLRETHPDLGVASTPVDDQRYDDGREQEPPPDAVVVVVTPEVGGGVVVGGGGLPGRVHPSAEAATSAAAIRTGPRRDRGVHPLALIGR
jgi:hypothetical protein